RRSSTGPAKNATARIAGAIARAARPGLGQAWPRSTRASHRSPCLTVLLPQFARDVFAQFFQHTRDGRFDVLGGRTVFQLLAEGVEQKLLFARLACRDCRSNYPSWTGLLRTCFELRPHCPKRKRCQPSAARLSPD